MYSLKGVEIQVENSVCQDGDRNKSNYGVICYELLTSPHFRGLFVALSE